MVSVDDRDKRPKFFSRRVWVADEGEGFDPAALPDPLASENLLRQSGRGVLMMQAFMDEFQICTRAPQGTEVKMVKYVARTSQEGGLQ